MDVVISTLRIPASIRGHNGTDCSRTRRWPMRYWIESSINRISFNSRGSRCGRFVRRNGWPARSSAVWMLTRSNAREHHFFVECARCRVMNAAHDFRANCSKQTGQPAHVESVGLIAKVRCQQLRQADRSGHRPIDRRDRQAALFFAFLGASNCTYYETTWGQGMPDWIGSHVRVFEFFGGVPAVLVPNNLKSGGNRPAPMTHISTRPIVTWKSIAGPRSFWRGHGTQRQGQGRSRCAAIRVLDCGPDAPPAFLQPR